MDFLQRILTMNAAMNSQGPVRVERPDSSTALKGGPHPVLPHPKPHAVLGTPVTGPWKEGQDHIILGLGCFWGAEKLMWQIDGVESTSVGYAGGYTQNPTYREVCTGRTGHAEVVDVVFDPAKVELREILEIAMENHDPTQGDRQGNDVGSQYRSVIYPVGDNAAEQAAVAEEVVGAYAARLRDAGYGDVTTEILPLAETPAGRYFLAEDEHQQYLAKNPDGYCPVHATGVTCR
ncbi:peptide-methionine (S)-S-oxide reductase MsrA [Corynebacterium provencense]|jgi:peptide-methionine (S)-S-oxide reductase|uniref:Peptide methionine sulfoxide reductase MsrA n=1 Tax=Corynebacterium provencense TaxID=1737425 RepID=A0A2Z3YP96_9CORY|nr:peptide-methionine (S)-S-oxide reductase MsrA [Corynebacterium provencense]AWT27295.1 Peptide methionine sulfoxide reductase MsrA [Corynebacterium provencense]MCI1257451.1 peptide-methionine (S)-S-oxide reductase MsrA [Corynebacterium provencense]